MCRAETARRCMLLCDPCATTERVEAICYCSEPFTPCLDESPDFGMIRQTGYYETITSSSRLLQNSLTSQLGHDIIVRHS